MAEKEFEVPESDQQTDTESEDKQQDPSWEQLDTEKEDQLEAQRLPQHQLEENDPKSRRPMLQSFGDKVPESSCSPGYARDSKGVCRKIVS